MHRRKKEDEQAMEGRFAMIIDDDDEDDDDDYNNDHDEWLLKLLFQSGNDLLFLGEDSAAKPFSALHRIGSEDICK